jgi:hypothetical protein
VAVGPVLAVLTLLLLLSVSILPSPVPPSPATVLDRTATVPSGGIQAATTGEPSEAPNFAGAYVVDHGQIFVYLGYAGFANLWSGVGTNGSEVFADGLYVLAFNLAGTPVSLTLDVKEKGYGWQNASVPIGVGSSVGVPIPLQQNAAWTAIAVDMGGTTWSGYVATPVSLLPLTDWNLGGVDLLVMVALSEAIIGFSFLTWLAWRLMKRACWAPKFSLIVWGHVFLLTTFVTVIADYQVIDQTFAGWSPLVYIAPLLPMWFAFALSLFNRTTKRECLQIVSLPNQRLMIARYLIRLGKNLKGEWVLIKETWGQFWARVFGHYVVLTPKDMSKPPALVIPVVNLASPTETGKGKHRQKGATKPKTIEWDEVPIVNDTAQDDEVSAISFIKPGGVVEVAFPHLTAHKTVHVEAHTVTHRNGDVEQIDAHDETHWCWPHYVEGSAEMLPLHDIHTMSAVAASALMLTAFDLSTAIGQLKTALYMLRSKHETTVDAEVDAQLSAYLALLGVTQNELNEEQADRSAVKRKDEPSKTPKPNPKGER